MFGKTLPEGSNITAQIKLRLGAGHPVLAWSGATDAKDAEVIEDISRNANVSKYVYKAIARGKLKQDEYGSVVIPCFLIAIEDQTIIEEFKIEICLMFASGDEQGVSPTVMFDKMFSVYANGLEKMAEQYTLSLVEAQKTLTATAQQSSKMLEASVEPFNRTLQIMHDAYNHESKRADSAADAVIRMLNAKASENKTDVVEDAVKLIGTLPVLAAVFEKLKGAK